MSSSSLARIISMERILFPPAGGKEQILEVLIDSLSGFSNGSREELAEAIFEREKLMSTGIGIGLAIPHCRLEGVKDVTAAVAVCPTEIDDYVSLDDKPVRLVVMILAGTHQQSEYIRILSQLSAQLKDEEVREKIIASRDPEEVYALLTGEDEQ